MTTLINSSTLTFVTPTACAASYDAAQQILAWMRAQPNVGEESITDWLLYQLSRQIPRLRYRKFTRHEEARVTGADWEWWFLFDTGNIVLRVQAKKLSPTQDNYAGIAKTNRHGLQIDKLMADAKARNHLPFYCFYTVPSSSSIVRCSGMPWLRDEAAFMADAQSVYDSFIKPARAYVSSDMALALSNPMSCMFCCPISDVDDQLEQFRRYLNRYHRSGLREGAGTSDWTGIHRYLPSYVERLLSAEIEVESPNELEDEDGPFETDAVVIYDARRRLGA